MLKIRPECIPCTIFSALRMARYASSDLEMHKRVVRIMMERLVNVSWEEIPSDLAFEAQEVVSEVTGVRDPYSVVKKWSNKRAMELYPEMKKLVSCSENSLEMAVKLAALGNSIDFGYYSEVDLESILSKIGNMNFALLDLDEFERQVVDAEKLIYFVDNAGEIVFDKVLIETMIDLRRRLFRRVTIVPKEEPLLNDATVVDVEEIMLNKLPNVVVKPIRRERKTDPNLRIEGFRDWIRDHDLAVFKGQVNFEFFLDEPDAFFILIAKCPIIADTLGVPQGSPVLVHSPHLSKT
ncbi:MAG: ARMT1-like domain-containing protein [Nitrososphaerota archaeon]|nr:ARMT1-like domain-containing protein [Nitrososphaerota archaeon]